MGGKFAAANSDTSSRFIPSHPQQARVIMNHVELLDASGWLCHVKLIKKLILEWSSSLRQRQVLYLTIKLSSLSNLYHFTQVYTDISSRPPIILLQPQTIRYTHLTIEAFPISSIIYFLRTGIADELFLITYFNFQKRVRSSHLGIIITERFWRICIIFPVVHSAPV